MWTARRLAHAASAVIALACATVRAGEAPDRAGDTAGALVRAHNAGDNGAPGWRRVRVDLSDAGTVTQQFTVVNVWRRLSGASQMLFFLEAPSPLHGTAYRVEERTRNAQDLAIHLWLPTAQRVLEVDEANHGDGLLGSDFSYEDFRLLLPDDGRYTYRHTGTVRMQDAPAAAIEVRRARVAGRWDRAVLYLRDGDGFLLGADYFVGDEPRAGKRMRVERLSLRDGVWTAERMAMTRVGGRRTDVTLLDARFHLDLPGPRLFEPADLPRVEPWIVAVQKKTSRAADR